MVSTTKIATAEWIQVSNAPAMEDDPEGRRIGWETLIKSENEHEAIHRQAEEVRGRREKDETKTEERRVGKSEKKRKKARAK
ncbi:hypothetical protein BZA77DRAFT_351207 [Pyronema omphalodes]|nr:hypothetical protein BZA77DRAFT_351688 [Pyronema omphalodes]KAI5819123.1 hypothetical protein BZA77DRAFT_351207 [Pyronema omphalodes]